MARFSANQLRSSPEVGNTSTWVVCFERGGEKSPDITKLNLINGGYFPAIDVTYNKYDIVSIPISFGPGIEFDLPVYAKNSPSQVDLTFYSDDLRLIKKELVSWVDNKLNIKLGKAPPLKLLKKFCLILSVYQYSKTGKLISKESFYVLPKESLAFHGDQSFSLDTSPLVLSIVGRQ
jgi:hypothetical protein